MTHADIRDWNRIAATYAQAVNPAEDRIYLQFQPVLWDILGDLRGRDVLDIGCGTGWLSQLLADAGAAVVGVDGSAALLAYARQQAPTIRWYEHHLTRGLPALETAFDRMVAHVVLIDLPDVGPLLASCRRLLRSSGSLVFTMPHPCFFHMTGRQDTATGEWYRMVRGYLAEEVWRLDSFGGHNHYHRTLTYYSEQLRTNGFLIRRLYEPAHHPGPQTDPTAAAFWASIPVFVLIEAVPSTPEMSARND